MMFENDDEIDDEMIEKIRKKTTLANIMCVDGLFGSPSEREKPG